ncbi:MAG: hypothetical protein QOH87_1272, partial [Trebonia sp.]|nr:hypothetical protein [Trebonia sp.]
AERGGHLALVNGRDATMYRSLKAAVAAGPVDGDTWTARARSAQGHETPVRKVNLHAIR